VRRGGARRTSRLLRALDPLGERLAIVPVAPPVPMPELFSRFWPYARPHRRRLLVVLLLVAVAPAVQAVEIGLYQRLVDDVLVPRDLRPFAFIALAYVGLNLLGAGLAYADDVASTVLTQRFLTALRGDLFSRLLRLPLAFHDRQRSATSCPA
jgi:ABC-type multidrug transport system fused ATPase/permease subunit